MTGNNIPFVEENLFEVGAYTVEVQPKFTIPPDIDPVSQPDLGEQQVLYAPEVGVLPVIKPQVRDLNKPTKRVAFGGFVKPIFYDPHGEFDLNEVTEREKKWMNKDNVAKALFNPRRTPTTLVVDRIGLNPYEHRLLVRYPTALANQALASVLGDKDLDEDRMAAAQRAITHELGPRREPMAEHLDKLRTAHTGVDRLLVEEVTPGFAHQRVDWMNEHISTTWLEFESMLDIVRTQRNWNDAKAVRAKAAFINYLTSGSQRTRVGNWQGMTSLASNHLLARIGLFSNSIEQVDTITALYPLPEPQQEETSV